MIDTGAVLNLIKLKALLRNARINRKDKTQIHGITPEKLTTKGSIIINILGYDVKFQVVANNFPIDELGILGLEFLGDTSIINLNSNTLSWNNYLIPFYIQEIVIPPRTAKVMSVPLRDTSLTYGYIPRVPLAEGLYMGEAIVNNINGLIPVQVFNTTNETKEIKTPILTLEKIEKYLELEPTNTEKTQEIKHIKKNDPDQQRIDNIEKLLKWDHLNEEEKQHVSSIVQKYSDLFHLPGEPLKGTNAISHRIITTDEQPISTKQYRFPPIHKEEIDKQVSELLNKDIIKPSKSPYNSPLWIVPKKPDAQGNKQWRMVIDYRSLNEKTIGDAYPLPNINEILDQLGSAKYFSILDLASGFHQIPMHKEDSPKTAFSTPYGHYEFNRMPFGLKNAPATFQRLMDQILTGLQGTELFVYLDDVVIYARSLQEHLVKFKKLAGRLQKAGLQLQTNKCEFLCKEVSYLGHIISEDGVKPDPKKLDAVWKFPIPKTDKNVKQFLGLAGYYRRFIQGFSKIAKPLTELLKNNVKFHWSKEQQKSFDTLRMLLCCEPLLQYPDFSKTFVLTTDASGYAIGGILSQGPIGRDLPIAYTSRLLTKPEINYSTIEKELLAIVYSVAHFRPYIYGRKFYLVTDHKPLVWLHSVKDPTSRLVRWRLKLAEYEYEIVYKAGKTNVNADALSRNPVDINTSVNVPEIEQKKHDFSILPMHQGCDTDSDSEPIFEADPRPDDPGDNRNNGNNSGNHDEDNDDNNNNTPSGGNETNTEQQGEEEEEDDDAESSSNGESSESAIIENLNPPYTFAKPDFQIVRDHFGLRRDNLVIFVTKTGEACDQGARILKREIPELDLRNHTLGRAKLFKQNKRNIIILTIKEKTGQGTDMQIFKEALHSLLDVVQELGLEVISICKSNVAEIHWDDVRIFLQRIFLGTALSIIICTNQIEIPDLDKRKDIIIENHVSAIGGHKGITKTYYRIKQRYFWPRMKFEIANFINNCRDCQIKKLVRIKTRQEMTLTDTPDAAFDKISMDIMGPLPTSSNGYNYILTIQDLLTKFSLAIQLKHAGAIDVADALVKELICVYGTPKAILTDQGSHFLNSLMRNIARKFRIAHFSTTAYRPQSNGSVERSHQVLWEYLKQFINNNDWDEHLRLAMFSYNTSMHEGTKYTPYELVFGRIARVPTADPPIDEEQNESYSNYLYNLYHRLRNAQECARQNLIASKKRSKQYYDKRARPYKFKINDEVYLIKEPNKGKLGDQYIGPFKIIEILSNNNVRIRISYKKTRIVHTDKLKIKKTRPVDTQRVIKQTVRNKHYNNSASCHPFSDAYTLSAIKRKNYKTFQRKPP